MKNNNLTYRSQPGFTLIEVMVAFAVLAFGLLAIVSFQSKLVSNSSHNKARSEAIALAQEKLDQIRSYTDEESLVANLEGAAAPTAGDEFPASMADGAYPAVAEPLEGVNADFERRWDVTVTGNVADVAVTVSWTDPALGAQSVSLNSAVTWKNPGGGAELTDVSTPLVPSATGRARLGEGIVPVTDVSEGSKNGDGTATGDFDSDGDLELVDLTSEDDDGNARVVLTLKAACNLDTGLCTDFVKIKGRVYSPSSGRALSDVYVLASDAAFCARDLADSGSIGTYNYYDYTCYIGGGWHGNIGILINANNADDYACVGDPDAEDAEPWLESQVAWKKVELVKRRVYRGVINKKTTIDSGEPVQDIVPGYIRYYATTDGNGDIVYYSKGIGDAVELPDPALTGPADHWSGYLSNWWFRDGGHDFVLINDNKPTRADCVTALKALEAAAGQDLFKNVPGDFVCLNNDWKFNWYSSGNPNDYNLYLDDFDEDTERAPDDCPFDPSDPPSHRFVISGDISTASEPDSMLISTSDGPNNCTWSIASTSTSYECNVYAWEDANGNINGWDGSITIETPAGLTCTRSGGSVYTNPTTQTYGDVTSNQSNQDYQCGSVATVTIAGTITPNGADLTGMTLAVNDGPDDCSFNTADNTYSCTVVSEWSGSISFGAPSGECDETLVFGTALTEDPTTGTDVVCEGPTTPTEPTSGSATVSGTISVYDFNRTSPNAPTIDGGGTCSLGEPMKNPNNSGTVTYTCHTATLADGDTWTGNVSFSTTDDKGKSYVCPATVAIDTPLGVGGAKTDVNVIISTNKCP